MRSLIRAIRFLFSISSPTGGPGDEPACCLHWIMPLGFAAGVLLAVIVGTCWGTLTYRPGGELWMAVVPAMLVYWLLLGTARYIGWGTTWATLRSAGRGVEMIPLVTLAIVAAAVCQFVALAMLPTRYPLTPPIAEWSRPLYLALIPPLHFGAIVLMGLWGSGAVLLAACLGRPDDRADPCVRQLLAERTWKKMTWAMAPTSGLTLLFLVGWSRQWGEPWATSIVPAVFTSLAVTVILFGVTTLFAWLLARKERPVTRGTLLAAGLIGEIGFLILFHALVR